MFRKHDYDAAKNEYRKASLRPDTLDEWRSKRPALIARMNIIHKARILTKAPLMLKSHKSDYFLACRRAYDVEERSRKVVGRDRKC